MAARFFLVLCASALLLQSIAECASCGCGLNSAASRAGLIAGAEIAAANNWASRGYASPAYAGSSIYTGPGVATASGGAFGVNVQVPYKADGVNVWSENSIDGYLEAYGSLPVFSTVTLDGAVPSSGAAGTSYGCGSDIVGISTDSLAAAGVNPARPAAGYAAAGLGAAIAGAEIAGINAGLAGARLARPSCGCGKY